MTSSPKGPQHHCAGLLPPLLRAAERPEGLGQGASSGQPCLSNDKTMSGSLQVTLMYVPNSQKDSTGAVVGGGSGGGHRAPVDSGTPNPAQKETEAWWSKKVKPNRPIRDMFNQRAAFNLTIFFDSPLARRTRYLLDNYSN